LGFGAPSLNGEPDDPTGQPIFSRFDVETVGEDDARLQGVITGAIPPE
jgi:hypothetical protein